MRKYKIDDVKNEYEKIEIPEKLEFIVKKSIKEGREKNRIKEFSKLGSGIAVAICIFIFAVNISPKLAYAASSIPGLDKLVKLVIFDKGFNNAVDEGLTKMIDYKEEKDGVKLIVNGVAGDYKRLWIDYELKGNDNYEIEVCVKDSITGEEIPIGIGFYDDNGMATIGNGYLEIAFQEFIEKFELEIKVGKKKYENEEIGIEDAVKKDENINGTFFERNNIEYITTFIVPITLEKEVFGNLMKEIQLTNNVIETDIGDIVIDKLESSKTRIVMTFKLDSDMKEYMGMKNPVLVDEKGNEYTLSTFYFSEDGLNNNLLEFTGEIQEDVKTLKLKCEGVYYADKDRKSVVVNLKDKYIENNPYDIELLSYEENVLSLKVTDIEGIGFKEITGEDGNIVVLNKGISNRSNDNGTTYEVISYLKILDENLEEIKLDISWIRKDKTTAFDVMIIE